VEVTTIFSWKLRSLENVEKQARGFVGRPRAFLKADRRGRGLVLCPDGGEHGCSKDRLPKIQQGGDRLIVVYLQADLGADYQVS